MSDPKYQVSGHCPVCNDQMYVARLECDHCHSTLEGEFQLGPFQNLTAEQLQFLEVFIRCRGQNKAVQELLDISYPTVIKKLDDLILALGYETDLVAERRREVLEMLSQNKISAVQAQQLLAGLSNSKASENPDSRVSSARRTNGTGE
ncbi:MAG: DUF2089 domain-containing protein [Chloroflexota bacterium]|nr:DUF2089 domain-containing protein [Chloroflexota bacterium]